MAMLIGQRVGKEVLEALGMPVGRCVSFELRVAVNEVVTVKAEYHADGDPLTIGEVFSGYLAIREAEGPQSLSDR